MVQKPPQDTLEDLLPPHLDAAYRVALRLTGDPVNAEDLVQDAAYLAAKGFGTFRQGTNFKAWFFRILTNAFYSKYRKERRAGETVDIDDTPEIILYAGTAAAGLQAPEADPVGTLLTAIATDEIEAALTALPEDYRVVATLYFADEFSYQEIAEVLDIPVGTVRSRLHRARKLLQRALWRSAVDHGIVPDTGGPPK